MSDLVNFLLARITEDEAAANASRQHGIDRDGEVADWMDFQYDHHVLTVSPARVLAECQSKRGIVEEHGGLRVCAVCFEEMGWDEGSDGETYDYPLMKDAPCPTLCALALPYASHPDYREEWRP